MAALIAVNVCAAEHLQAEEKQIQREILTENNENTAEVPSESTTQAVIQASEEELQNGKNNAEKHSAENTTAKPENGFEPTKPAGKGISTNKGVLVELEEETESLPAQITVTVSINCTNAVEYGADVPEYFLKNQSYTATEGATVFDALKALCEDNGLSLKYQRKTYIQGIGGLNEKDCGSSSGWMYLVNGEKLSKPASGYALKNGDTVEWRYVTNSEQ